MQIVVYSRNKILINEIRQVVSSLVDSYQIPIQLRITNQLCFNDNHDQIIYLLDQNNLNVDVINYILKVISSKQLAHFILLSNNQTINNIAHNIAAIDVLSKPFNNDELKIRLSYILSSIIKSQRYIILDRQPQCKLFLSSIFYLEKNNRFVNFITTNGVYQSALSLQHWLDQLAPFGFIKIYRSIIVNINSIVSYDKHSVTLANQTRLPISRRLYKNLTTNLSSK